MISNDMLLIYRLGFIALCLAHFVIEPLYNDSLPAASAYSFPNKIPLKELSLSSVGASDFRDLADKLLIDNDHTTRQHIKDYVQKHYLDKGITIQSMVLYVHTSWCLECKKSMNSVCRWIKQERKANPNTIFIAAIWKSGSKNSVSCSEFDLYGIIDPKFAQDKLHIEKTPEFIVIRNDR